MPSKYDQHGLTFLYPENWELQDQVDDALPYQVSLETPGGGLWSLNMFPRTDDPDEILDGAVAALQEQFDDVELSLAEKEFEAFPSRGIDANFFCLDFVVTARIRVFETEPYQLLNWYQAESREFDQQHDVFRAVTQSMLQSVATAEPR